MIVHGVSPDCTCQCIIFLEAEMDYGLKLLAADDGSITSKFGRVIYPLDEWVTVPGNGAYVAITDGLNSANGKAPMILGFFETDEPTGAPAPTGVVCYRKVRRRSSFVIKTFPGSLDLRGCDLKGITLPETVGGSLDLSGCDLKGITLPETVGGSLDLRRSEEH